MADRFVFTAPDGGVLDLTDDGVGLRVLAAGTRGLRSPAYRTTTSRIAGGDGAQLDALTAEEGDIALGLLVQASDEDELRARLRRLVHVTRPKAGDGVLRVSRPDGTSRSLTCRIIDGLPGSEEPGETRPGRWWRCLLKIWAGDPWWYGDPVVVGFGLAEPSVFWSTTLPQPRSLSSSSVQGQRDLDVRDVDDPTPGLWTVTGPGVGLTLVRNVLRADGTVDLTPVSATDPTPRYRKTLTSSVTIPDGGTVVIRTKRGEQSIRRGDGSNLGGTLAAGSSFWQLLDGRVNRVSVQLGGAGSSSWVQLGFDPKYGGI